MANGVKKGMANGVKEGMANGVEGMANGVKGVQLAVFLFYSNMWAGNCKQHA